jgi:predicted RNase H-like nuclease
MPAVLGIDAAWTSTQPSGVALVAKDSTKWRLVAVAPSYRHFMALSQGALVAPVRPAGSLPEVEPLLAAASSLCAGPVDLVAVDMPLARSPIVARRYCDDQVSRAYGSRKCGTYPPSVSRPGTLSDALTRDFASAGYPLLTEALVPPGVIEVYPHPALVELTGATERLRYKASKATIYWPSVTPLERRRRLLEEWEQIFVFLETEIDGVMTGLPQPELSVRGMELKGHEDMLDAIVCAWVGICALEGRAIPYGDDDAAIWIPQPRTLGPGTPAPDLIPPEFLSYPRHDSGGQPR